MLASKQINTRLDMEFEEHTGQASFEYSDVYSCAHHGHHLHGGHWIVSNGYWMYRRQRMAYFDDVCPYFYFSFL